MKRTHTTLVSQYLEGISRAALAEYQQFFREQARQRNGVYAPSVGISGIPSRR